MNLSIIIHNCGRNCNKFYIIADFWYILYNIELEMKDSILYLFGGLLMKLFVSDLDGTLLNSNAEISEESIEIINDLIDKGLNFTIATARSLNSVEKIILPLKLTLPIILNNGVFIYDALLQKNILSNLLDKITVIEIIDILKAYNINPFIYKATNKNENKIYYKGIFNDGEEFHIKNRSNKGDKRFILIDEFSSEMFEDVITIIAIGSAEYLTKVHEFLVQRQDISIHYYKDVYFETYYLEIANSGATKSAALEYLKEYLKVDELTCFGDNLNDCSMFKLADYKYAVGNANETLKKMATEVIGSNDEDGVAKFLKSSIREIII